MRRNNWFILPATLPVLIVAGCLHSPKHYERLVRISRKQPPSWTRSIPPSKDGDAFFVGRSIAVNVLDERRAMLRAKHDAAYDIALSIMAEVHGAARWTDMQHGDEVRGVESVDTNLHNQITVLTDQILSGFREIESYWELWEVADNPPGAPLTSFRRYKYFVLVSFPEKELERCRREVKKNGRIG